jgi:hypothetical protein
VDARAEMTEGKGSRTSPEKEKPKMESMMKSVWESWEWKSDVNGISRSWSCVVRRCVGTSQLSSPSYVFLFSSSAYLV